VLARCEFSSVRTGCPQRPDRRRDDVVALAHTKVLGYPENKMIKRYIERSEARAELLR
jgi:hypothetical protein